MVPLQWAGLLGARGTPLWIDLKGKWQNWKLRNKTWASFKWLTSPKFIGLPKLFSINKKYFPLCYQSTHQWLMANSIKTTLKSSKEGAARWIISKFVRIKVWLKINSQLPKKVLRSDKTLFTSVSMFILVRIYNAYMFSETNLTQEKSHFHAKAKILKSSLLLRKHEKRMT